MYDEQFMKDTLSKIYQTPKFKQYQKDFECRLGNYAYNLPKSLSVVDDGINKLKTALYERNIKEETFTPTNTPFEEDAVNSQPQAETKPKDINSKDGAKTKKKQPKKQINSKNNGNNLRAKVEAFYKDTCKYDLIDKYSGGTASMLKTCQDIGFNKGQLLDFRLALIGYFLSKSSKSQNEEQSQLHKMLDISHTVGIFGNEDITDISAMDECVSPLEKDEIVKNCGRTLGNLPDSKVQQVSPNYSEKMLPLDEYVCSRFIAASVDAMNSEDDDTNISYFANTDKNRLNQNILNLPSFERLSLNEYGKNMYMFMNRKLFLGSDKFNDELRSNLKNDFFNYILDLCNNNLGKNNGLVSKNAQQSPSKIFSEITGKKSFKRYVVYDLIPKLNNYTSSVGNENSFDKIKSFCEAASNELVNKYFTQRISDDVDILNLGLARYFKNSQKYTGTVYSGRFITDNDNIKEGETYIVPSQISSSKDYSIAQNFTYKQSMSKKNGRQPSFWTINLKGYGAVDFSNASPFPHEQEVLIPLGTKFKVDRVVVQDLSREGLTVKNVVHIYLTEIE